MDIMAARRVTYGQDRRVFKGRGRPPNNIVCAYWLAGRCTRNPCRFMHRDYAPLTYNRNPKQSPKARLNRGSNISSRSPAASSAKEGGSGLRSTEENPEIVAKKNQETVAEKNQDKVCHAQKNQDKVCEYWLSGNCVHDDRCRYMHSWFRGDDFTRLTYLEGHKKVVTGIALPSGFDKLYSGSSDGTVRVWDCNTGQCVRVIHLESEVGSLVSEGPWVFAGTPDVVKAWNVHTSAEYSLSGPAGQVYAMIVGKDTLFAGAQDGSISAWKSGSETNPFNFVASLKGHNRSVVSLAVGGNMLYSGSMDLTIRVWDIDVLHCVQTLNGHTEAVMSLLCWDSYLLSCSLDGTIKVWIATESGKLEVTYTHNEKHGVLALFGMHDAEAKPILFSSCNDNSVRLYELPSFSDRGKLFAKREVRTIQLGPGGLFFTGDQTGQVAVWKWLAEPSAKAS